ncbi:MAG: hypothetical protein GF375_03375 [Candidatus Omnitrophica bacterium]|nr:hypothetical protein [Candidatus Omnitrophota bacterium]MBD3269116.1 hypothetical protein [Candidatus Omnitrophota bacterium]
MMFYLSFRERRVLICLGVILLLGGGFKFIKKEKNLNRYYNNAEDASTDEAAAKLIEINKADTQELQRLPGVGPVLALRIKEFIKEQGPVKSGEDLQKVKGIGEKKAGDMVKYIIF